MHRTTRANMTEIKIVKKTIDKTELRQIATGQFGDMVKAVVDVENNLLALGGEFHIDMQTLLRETENSKGAHTWGINLYPDKNQEEFIEFDSMINLKPALGNRSRNIESVEIQNKIKKIVGELITE